MTALTTNDRPSVADGAIPGGGAPDRKLARLREELPAVAASGYFNAGSNGPLPRCSHQAPVAAAEVELELGRIRPGTYDRNRERNRQVAATLAAVFGADADEIALTHSSTEGLGVVLMGISWRPGDEVLTTPLEHPGLLVPLGLIAHRFGVVLRQVPIGLGEGDVVEAISAAMTPRTRLIALSHLMWSSGAVVPLREIADLARRHGVLVVVDGAQSAGQIPVHVHDLGVDAYAISGQKWLCGPEGTGALFVRRDRFADIAPTYVRYGQFDISGYFMPTAGAMRYEVGEFYNPAVIALETSVRWLADEVDLQWATDRTATLGRRCHDGLTQINGVTVLTPRERMAGLVCFNIGDLTPQAVTAALHERGMTIRYVDVRPCPPSARVSAAWWNTEDEVDRLIAAVTDLAAPVS